MGKKAAQDVTNKGASASDDIVVQSLQAFSAKRQFVVSSLSMGWQLAGVVVIPVFIGVKLDNKFNSSPSYTLAALILAICGAVFVIKNTIALVNREQKEANRKGKK